MTDAFEKLAELVGASVEADPSQGLPRTWAEARALGVKRYFTGKPCKHGHVAERRVSSLICVECERQYESNLEVKERKRQYVASPKYREYKRQYITKPEVKERCRQRDMAKTGDAALFAINQAEVSAVRGIAYDIVPQCPEPHRSQLQALVDRIRADPTAGKAVIRLLRSMRDLRKLEIAEKNMQDDTTASSP